MDRRPGSAQVGSFGLRVFGGQVWVPLARPVLCLSWMLCSSVSVRLSACLSKSPHQENELLYQESSPVRTPPKHLAFLLPRSIVKVLYWNATQPSKSLEYAHTLCITVIWQSQDRHEREVCGSFVSGAPPACSRSSETRWWRFCDEPCVTSPPAVQCACHNVENISVIITTQRNIFYCSLQGINLPDIL